MMNSVVQLESYLHKLPDFPKNYRTCDMAFICRNRSHLKEKATVASSDFPLSFFKEAILHRTLAQ